jgi:hypothetical protein
MNADRKQFETVSVFLKKLGWDVLQKPKIEDNYFDLTAVSKKKTLRVEIKTAQKKSNGTWQSGPISKRQMKADVVAVVLPSGDIFVEKMEDYLLHCSNLGTRQFTWLKP